MPRSLPAIGAATRAQLLSCVALSHGNFSFTRPSPSSSLLLVTMPITTPVMRPSRGLAASASTSSKPVLTMRSSAPGTR